MANNKPGRHLPRRKKPTKPVETVRQRAAKKSPSKNKIKLASSGTSKLRSILSTSFHLHKHNQRNRLSHFLTRPRNASPRYLRNVWYELTQVTWPKLPEALRLTFGVFIFSIVLAAIVYGLDWLLDKAFEEIIINQLENVKNLF